MSTSTSVPCPSRPRHPASATPAMGLNQQLQLTASIRGGQHAEPAQPTTNRTGNLCFHLGLLAIRVILVVITDRASPRPTISSFQSPRRVARSPHSQVRGEEPHYLRFAQLSAASMSSARSYATVVIGDDDGTGSTEDALSSFDCRIQRWM